MRWSHDEALTVDTDREGAEPHLCAGCRKPIEGTQPYCVACYQKAQARPAPMRTSESR